jgi:uncharacterized membrane-anchored protein
MIQFYFLSVLFNAAAGYVLVMDEKTQDGGVTTGPYFFLDNDTIRLILGILTLISGLLKLLSAIQGDIPVIGDLLPAIMGLIAGFILIYEYYHTKTELELKNSEILDRILLKNKKWVGFVAVASAILHFLFPSVLFL